MVFFTNAKEVREEIGMSRSSRFLVASVLMLVAALALSMLVVGFRNSAENLNPGTEFVGPPINDEDITDSYHNIELGIEMAGPPVNDEDIGN